jgi:hypothetical protein
MACFFKNKLGERSHVVLLVDLDLKQLLTAKSMRVLMSSWYR